MVITYDRVVATIKRNDEKFHPAGVDNDELFKLTKINQLEGLEEHLVQEKKDMIRLNRDYLKKEIKNKLFLFYFGEDNKLDFHTV